MASAWTFIRKPSSQRLLTWLGSGGRRVGRSKTHLGSLPRAFFRLEIGVVTREAAHARHQTVREQHNKCVVVLHHLVITAALHGNAIFRARQFVLQAKEVLVGFQNRIIFHDQEQPPQSSVQLLVGGDFIRGRPRRKQR